MREVNVHEFAVARADGAFAIDVREPHEFTAGHVPGVVLMPMSALRIAELPKGEPVYVVCASGNRSRTVALELSRIGFDAVTVNGGTSGWDAAGYPVVRGEASNVA